MIEQAQYWQLAHRATKAARMIADRHYSRQKVGSSQFVPPGRCLVLMTPEADAYWVTSWPFAEYVKHAWAGAWICSAFRNESPHLSSLMIREAVAITRWYFGAAPEPHGMISFIDTTKVRKKRDFGRCYLRAGWSRVEDSKGGLITMQLLPVLMPDPMVPIGGTVAMELAL